MKIAILCSFLGLSLTLGQVHAAQQVDLRRVSVASGNGAQANASSFRPSLSGDGRFSAFHSLATNLGTPTNGLRNVFVHDSGTGQTERISTSYSGGDPDAECRNAAISENGRYVAFYSRATDLTPGGANGHWQGYVRDRWNGTTQRFTANAAGVQANGPSGGLGAFVGEIAPAISADGRFIAFPSAATNLGVVSGAWQIWLKDTQTGAVTLVSRSSAGAVGNFDSWHPSISADGAFVSFASAASNLVPGDTNAQYDVFVFNVGAGTIERVNLTNAGAQSMSGWANNSSLSADGRYVAFDSNADDLIAASMDTNADFDVFVRDRLTGTTVLASRRSDGTAGSGQSGFPRISGDGTRVVFQSQATDLLEPNASGAENIFVLDLATSVMTRISNTELSNRAETPAISRDGQVQAFQCASPSLVPGDTNSAWDVFTTMNCGGSFPISVYCTAGTTSHGCVPRISATPFSAPAGTGLRFRADDVDGQRQGLFVTSVAGPNNVAFGGGGSRLCLRSPLQRSGLLSSGGTAGVCDGVLESLWLDGPVGISFPVWAQFWFRDPGVSPQSVLSDAIWFQRCAAPGGQGG